jgi:hypothetical protein
VCPACLKVWSDDQHLHLSQKINKLFAFKTPGVFSLLSHRIFPLLSSPCLIGKSYFFTPKPNIMKTLNPCSRMAFLLAIAVLALSPSLWGQSTGAFEIYLADTKTGEAVQLTDNSEIGFFNASFSNNGKWIVADAVYPGDQALVLIDVKTGEFVTQIWGGNDASWSPNGNILAFDAWLYGYPQLLTMVPYEETYQLVRDWGVDPEWSPNSQRLVFTDFWTINLRTVDVLTGEETIVADFGVNASWSPNGNYIVYSDWNNLFKIAVNNAGEPMGDPVQLTFDGPNVYNQQPSWSNNSQYIVFHSNRGGADFDIWMVDADGGEPTLFSGFPVTGDYDPCYSKNGKWVAFSSAGPDCALECPELATIELTVEPPGETNDTDVPFPMAENDCLGMVPAAGGTRSDGQPLEAPWPIGTTEITWTFIYGTHSITCTQLVVVIDDYAPVYAGKVVPDAVALQQNYPNPFADATIIRFELNEPATVSLQIYDAQGARVKTLASGEYAPGIHVVEWGGTGADGQVLPAGIYTYTLVTGDTVLTKRMIRVQK